MFLKRVFCPSALLKNLRSITIVEHVQPVPVPEEVVHLDGGLEVAYEGDYVDTSEERMSQNIPS